MSKTTYKALGAYIFAGGFTRGVLDTKRFEVLGHLEEGPYGTPTARLNFPRLPIHIGFDSWQPERFAGKVDFVYGNPPCAAWSRLNGRKTASARSWERDVRVDCTRHHFNLLKVIKPKVWVWESVDMAMNVGADFIYTLSNEALGLGYSVSHLRFDAQYVGGTHRRLRYFMVAHKIEIEWGNLIKFTTPPLAGNVLERATKYKTADDLMLYPMPKSLIKAWKLTPPGKSIRAYWDDLNPEEKRDIRVSSTGKQFFKGRPGFSKVKLDPNDVCQTIVGNNIFHHSEPRHLTLGEQKALCGYPPGWRVENEGRHSSARFDLLTRAVMPPIGRWISGMVARSLDDGVKIRNPRMLIIDARKHGKIDITPWQHETKQLSFDMEVTA